MDNFIDFYLNFLKECFIKGILTSEHNAFLIEYQNKLIEMASIVDEEGLGKCNLALYIEKRFEEEFNIR